jgi:hypothetical protein
MSTLRLTTISNQGGTASVPSDTVINGTAKAWVNFNGTGTVAIRGGFNVSSITDIGAGNYQVNFTNSLPDTNYSIAGLSQNSGGSPPCAYVAIGPGDAGTSTNYLLTTSARVSTGVYGVGGSTDSGFVTVAVFR